MSYDFTMKGNPQYQYAYCHSPLYCRMDRSILDEMGWAFFDDLVCDIDAPECYPIGSTYNRDNFFKGFVYRGYDVVEHREQVALAKRLIAEILKEEA